MQSYDVSLKGFRYTALVGSDGKVSLSYATGKQPASASRGRAELRSTLRVEAEDEDHARLVFQRKLKIQHTTSDWTVEPVASGARSRKA